MWSFICLWLICSLIYLICQQIIDWCKIVIAKAEEIAAYY